MDQGHGAKSPREGTVGFSARLDNETVHQLLQGVMGLVSHTLDGRSVSLSVARGTGYRTSNSTGPVALALDEAQYQQGDGPCIESMRSKRQLQASIGEKTHRWPRFDEQARRSGIAGVLSTPLLGHGGETIGSLNIYAATPNFGGSDARTATLFAEHASVLVGFARALADASQLDEKSGQAVATGGMIRTAKDMQSQSSTPDEPAQPERLAPDDDDRISLVQAARTIGVSPRTLERWAVERRIPCQAADGGKTLFRLVDLRAHSIQLDSSEGPDNGVEPPSRETHRNR